eukprot:509838_1
MQSSKFTSGLFDCCDSGCCDCLCAFCFFPCFVGTVMENKDGTGCCSTCLGITFCGVICSAFSRKSVRDSYRIEGGICSDCCAMCFCHCCAALQMKREVEVRSKRTMNQ